MAAQGRISPSDNIPRATFASYMAAAATGGRFGGKSAAVVARTLWPSDQVSPRLVSRAAVTGATTATDAWAGALAQESTGAFLAALPQSAASRLISAGQTVPLAGRSSVRFPRRSGVPEILPWIAEGGAIPTRAYALDSVTLGPASKLGIIIVLTGELAKASDASDVFMQLLKEDTAYSLDSAIFGTEPATDDSPAGLLDALTPLTAAPDGGLTALQSDLAALASTVAEGGGSGSLAYVMNPAEAGAVAIYASEMRLAVWPSRAIPPGRVIAIDPSGFVSGFGPTPEITSSAQTTLHTSDDPADIGVAGSPATVAAPSRSLFQTRTIAVRVIMDVAYCMRAPVVAYVEDTTW